MNTDTKNCPYCGEEILAVAKKCKHCGEWLDKTAYNEPPIKPTRKPVNRKLITIKVLSIAGLSWCGLMLIGIIAGADAEEALGIGLLTGLYGIVFSIVALALSKSIKSKALKRMSIFGILWWASAIRICITQIQYSAHLPLTLALVTVLSAMAYLIALSLVGLVQSNRRIKELKHEGEWFDNTPAPVKTKTLKTYKLVSKPNYRILSILSSVMLFFVVLFGLQELTWDTGIAGSKGIFGILAAIFDFIPQWLIVICYTAIFVYLMLGLRRHYMATCTERRIPFIAFISLNVCLYLSILMMLISHNDVFTAGIFAIPFVCILNIIVGLRLKNKVQGAITVGKLMMIYAFVPVFTFVIIIFEAQSIFDAYWLTIIIDMVIVVILFYALRKFFTNEDDKQNVVEDTEEDGYEEPAEKKPVIEIVGGAIVAATVIFILLWAKTEVFDKPIDYSLQLVNLGGDWGYINHKGKEVIRPQFGDAFSFRNGLAKVKSSDGIGYINKRGNYVIPAAYSQGTHFSDGLAFVVLPGGYPTCIDKKGNVKFVLEEAQIVYKFNEGLAMFINTSGKYGFVDKNGETVIDAQFDLARPFFEGFAIVQQNGKLGYIDKTGKTVIEPQFERAGHFSEGKASVYDGEKWGYIDTKGTYIINPQFDGAGLFSEGLAAVRKGDLFGYINKRGKLVIEPQFLSASIFSYGLAVVQDGGPGKYRFINKKGKYVANEFTSANIFFGNTAPVSEYDKKWRFMDKKGNIVGVSKYDNAKSYAPWALHYVESEYYDASEFVNSFLKKDAGATFDGFTDSTTLYNLANHQYYGDSLIFDRQYIYLAKCHKEEVMTKDVSIGAVFFIFDTPIYGLENEFDYSSKLGAIRYEVNLNRISQNKRRLLTDALQAEIERRHQQEMYNAHGDQMVLRRNDGKPSLIIIPASFDDKLRFYVIFSNKAWDMLMRD